MKKTRKIITDFFDKWFTEPELEDTTPQHINIKEIELDDCLENKPKELDVYRKNRFIVDFPGIPPYLFSSYKYMGTDVHSQKRLLSSKKVIVDDYSILKVVMTMPSGDYDICERLKELEENPIVGDVIIRMLGEKGKAYKKIIVPDCKVTEIRAFREMDYAAPDEECLMYGEIIIKHKQRKLI